MAWYHSEGRFTIKDYRLHDFKWGGQSLFSMISDRNEMYFDIWVPNMCIAFDYVLWACDINILANNAGEEIVTGKK